MKLRLFWFSMGVIAVLALCGVAGLVVYFGGEDELPPVNY